MGRRGKPLVADEDKDRCEALTVMTEWKKANHKEQQCPFVVKLSIGKKRLCYRHAILESLAILLIEGRAQILPSPPRPKYSQVPTIKDRH